MRFSANNANPQGPQSFSGTPQGGPGEGLRQGPKGPGANSDAVDRHSSTKHAGHGMSESAVLGGADPVEYGEETIAQLLFMIEEEKLAGDLYEAFHDQTGIIAFARIADSEDRHMAALLDQAGRIGLDTDALLSLPAGEYLNDDLDAMYLELLNIGSESATAALGVGVLVESTDIADLEQAAIGLVGTPLGAAYDNLLAGSASHLAAFEGLLGG